MLFKKLLTFFAELFTRIKSFFSKKKEPPTPDSTSDACDTGIIHHSFPELRYLEEIIIFRLDEFFPSLKAVYQPAMPEFSEWSLPVKNFLIENNLNQHEATLLLIGLTPHVQSDLFDRIIEYKLSSSGNFPKIGGVRGKNARSFLPTGETALFLLGGDDLDKRLCIQPLFWADHLFGKKKILWLEELPQGEPALSGRMIMSQDYIDTFTLGKPTPPHFSMSFPAKQIHTTLNWDDLVIDKHLMTQILDIHTWLKHKEELMNDWGMDGRLRKGYRTLFYGPPGTGKSFTAGLLGKATGQEVFRVDLSMVVSKYIGETEKNLEMLFARAEDKNWILFFDEADALFGKRSVTKDANDKYANQEVSYLLQRIEDYNGLIILATNMKNNIDEAFIRRFNSILKFTLPDSHQRSLIWKKSLPQEARFLKSPALNDIGVHDGESVNIPELVKKYELTGGNIINIVHYAGIKAVEHLHTKKDTSKQFALSGFPFSEDGESNKGENKLVIYLIDVLDGIRKEMVKEGKTFGV